MSWNPADGAVWFIIALFIFIFMLELARFISYLGPKYNRWRN